MYAVVAYYKTIEFRVDLHTAEFQFYLFFIWLRNCFLWLDLILKSSCYISNYRFHLRKANRARL